MLPEWSKTIVFILLCALQRPASAQRLSWRNISADQGLPGNEVYDILPAQSGYLWFATSQGLARYNGYTFVQPTDTSALRGGEAFTPAEDARGRIWFTRLDGSVWYVENDSVRAWKYNAVTAPFRKKNMPVEEIAIATDGTVWLALSGLGFLAVREAGSHSVVPEAGGNFFVFMETGGKLIYSTVYAKTKAGLPADPVSQHYEVLQWSNWQAELLDKRLACSRGHYSERGIWKLRNGDLIIACLGTLSLVRKGRMVWQRTGDILPRKIVEMSRGEILIASPDPQNGGLFYAASPEHLRRGEYRNLLPGHFVNDVQCDREGGWWAATHYAGVFYCKNPGMDIFDTATGLLSDEVRCLTTDGANRVMAGLHPAAIVTIERSSMQQHALPHPFLISRSAQALFFDTARQQLWCSDPLFFLNKKQWHEVLQWNNRAAGVLAKTITPDPTGTALWTSGVIGFFRVDARSGLAEQFGRTDSLGNFGRTFSVAPDREGNIWVTTNDGLRLWRNGQYALPPFEHPALRFQPRDMALLPDGGLAIGLRGKGVLIRDQQGKFTHLSCTDGMSSDMVGRIFVNPAGVIFACTSAGLNRLSRGADGRWRIDIINVKQGLPSNQINDVVQLSGVTWVATNRGLARFRELPAPVPIPMPVLEQLLVNNHFVALTPDLRLAHDENNLSVRFYALHFRSEGDIPYRYRLLGSDTMFVYSHTREVNYASLEPGAYTFEVQAQNESGAWGEPLRWSFKVQPAWWQTWWFWAFLALFAAAGLWRWTRARLRKTRHEAAVQHKIRDLESAALRAQINPHFIFNCLGSIQQFITENDAAPASAYLARFARLVRLALHGSVDGRHTLAEEMEMLDNYLALEQLRFRNRFVFSIGADPALDPEEIWLPPMLVQPFVENALLHGMKNKTDGGRIAVAFSVKDNLLLVTVTDNGPGVAATRADAEGLGRKSVGMMLTQRRLDVLAGKGGEGAFAVEAIGGADGVVAGTRVVLSIFMG